MTKIALSSLTLFCLIGDGLIRAGLKAQRAADTGIGIQDDQTILSPSDGFHRTDLRTGRLITMTAAIDLVGIIGSAFDHLRSVFRNGDIL
jgi:hypothetical protein